MVETKIGNMLLKTGKLSDAAAAYAKAAEIADVPFSLEHMDIPALYVAAEAQAGLGDVVAAQARKVLDPAQRTKLLSEARGAYAKSLNIWQKIPNPSPYGPNGYLARVPSRMELQTSVLQR